MVSDDSIEFRECGDSDDEILKSLKKIQLAEAKNLVPISQITAGSGFHKSRETSPIKSEDEKYSEDFESEEPDEVDLKVVEEIEESEPDNEREILEKENQKISEILPDLKDFKKTFDDEKFENEKFENEKFDDEKFDDEKFENEKFENEKFLDEKFLDEKF